MRDGLVLANEPTEGRSRFARLALMLVFLSWMTPVQAQTAADYNEGLQVTAGTQAGDFTLSWWGKAGRTYFIQQSFDLMTWQYVPVVVSGAADVCGMNFTCSDFRQFWRLRYTDQAYTGEVQDADFDGDGLTNLEELTTYHSDPFEWDTDQDGLGDEEEVNTYFTDPASADTDGDALDDYWEVQNSLDPNSATGVNGAQGDPDGDNLDNQTERMLSFTDPHDGDTDDDTLTDGAEYLIYHTSPHYADTDGDDLTDAAEINIHTTDPNNSDTDGDEMHDGWEIEHSLDPKSAVGINGAEGDPDADQLTNLEEYYFYSNPHDSDSDDDSLSDYAEVYEYYTAVWNADTDLDGLNDGLEILTWHTDPFNSDSDSDTLTDGEEVFAHGTNPLDVDTDGDWMWDDWELSEGFNPASGSDAWLDADGDGLSNVTEFLFKDDGYDPHVADSAGFDWQGDGDRDGLTNQQELVTYHTNPTQPDTDGDTLEDGWEIEYGMSAIVNNNTDAINGNDADDDPDLDHLDNEMECQLGTDPFDEDTDEDGVNDDVEEAQATNPKNPASKTPPPTDTVTVSVTFGDHSASHSERYEVHLTPVEGDPFGQDRTRQNSDYGLLETKTFVLPKGAKYTVSLVHKGTDKKYRDMPRPDYDYTLEFSMTGQDADTALVTEDTQGMLGEHWESNAFFANGKTATLNIAHITSLTEAIVPTDRKRRKLGVGERTTVSVIPSGLPQSAFALVGSNVGNTTLNTQNGFLRAGYEACNPSVTTSIGDKTLQIDFTVVPPSMITFEKVPGSDNNNANPLSVSMQSKVYIGPDDVNFGMINVIRETVVPAVADGYFSYENGQSHTTISPAQLSTTLVAGKGWELQATDTISGSTNGPQYNTGTFTWTIPWKYRIDTTEGDIGTPAVHVKKLEILSSGKAKLILTKKQQGADDSRRTETSITEP
jgi:hypothetical protein